MESRRSSTHIAHGLKPSTRPIASVNNGMPMVRASRVPTIGRSIVGSSSSGGSSGSLVGSPIAGEQVRSEEVTGACLGRLEKVGPKLGAVVTVMREAALKEGKPANIVEKMIDGRMRNFYAEKVLTEQPFVKDEQKTVGKVAQEGGLKLVQFVHWELGKA